MSADNNSETTLITGRHYTAPSEAIFNAFEDPEKLAQWWGPAGFTNTFETFEFTPDGRWLFTMHAPNGVDFLNDSFFREIERNRRIVIEHVVEPWFILTVTLDPDPEGGTNLSWNQKFANGETADKMRPLAETANQQVLDRLGAIVEPTS